MWKETESEKMEEIETQHGPQEVFNEEAKLRHSHLFRNSRHSCLDVVLFRSRET